jgi:hypothetical protein
LKLQVFEDNLSLLSDENDTGAEEETTNHNRKIVCDDEEEEEEEHFVRCPPNSLENNQSDAEEQQLHSQCSSSPSDSEKNGKVIACSLCTLILVCFGSFQATQDSIQLWALVNETLGSVKG